MSRYRAAVVGLRGIGRAHAAVIGRSERTDLVAAADIDAENLNGFLAEHPGVRGYADWAELLATERPDIAVIATSNTSHAPLTRMAVEAGVRGIICEKPMTVHLQDARAMVAQCEAAGATLVVNHQRRLLPALQTMRRLIAEGAIGEVQLVRSANAGDILSDGTHAVDSIRYLLGDPSPEWVYGSVFRADYPAAQGGTGFDKVDGWRFGHAVEDAGMAVVQFAGNLRAEFFFGELFPAGRWYQDYEVLGSQGRLWRPCDGLEPKLRMLRGDAWEEVPLDEWPEDVMGASWSALETILAEGGVHPLDGGRQGLPDMELVTAILHSAVTRQKVTFPFDAPRFPLDALYPNSPGAQR